MLPEYLIDYFCRCDCAFSPVGLKALLFVREGNCVSSDEKRFRAEVLFASEGETNRMFAGENGLKNSILHRETFPESDPLL